MTTTLCLWPQGRVTMCWGAKCAKVTNTAHSIVASSKSPHAMKPELHDMVKALCQHNCAQVHKARSIKAWSTKYPSRIPRIPSIKYLWDKLEWRLGASVCPPTCSSLRMSKNSHRHTSEYCISPLAPKNKNEKLGATVAAKGPALYYSLWIENAPVGVMCRWLNSLVHVV